MAETQWTARFTGPSMLERNKSQTVSFDIEKSGLAASVGSATFSLFDNDGTTIKDAVACTVVGGTVTATIDASDTNGKEYAKNWLLQFDVTIAGKVYTFFNDAVLCAARLYPPIGQTDLIAKHSDVVNLVSASKANLQDYIDTAWSDITGQMYSDAVPYWKYRTPSALRPVMFARCFEIIFRDYSTLFDAGDRYSELADRYANQYDKQMAKLRSKIDINEDNKLDGDAVPATSTIYLSSGPRQRWL